MKTAATYEDIDSIYPNPNNPRQNKHVIGEVAKSIARFGFSSPIIARQQDRQIIAGHTRYAAAVKLKMKTIPVRFLSLDEYEATALALADNRLAEKAKWNEDKLQNILQTLSAEDIPLDDIGFTRAELEYFLNQNNTEDDAPPIDDQSDHPPNDLQVNSWYKTLFVLWKH
jgi:ParB-like chromosome segregation protein Spo0J